MYSPHNITNNQKNKSSVNVNQPQKQGQPHIIKISTSHSHHLIYPAYRLSLLQHLNSPTEHDQKRESCKEGIASYNIQEKTP
jgi:hypothetical protein